MIIFKSYIYYIFMFLSCYLTGASIISFFKDRNIVQNKLYLAPIFGLLFFILFAYFLGTFNGFSGDIPLYSFIIIIIISIFIIYAKMGFKGLNPFSFTTLIFVFLGSLSVFGPIILYSGFNPFNDSFTYLVHAQWLQENSFRELTTGSGYYPAETQVHLYQKAGHRMGGSFLLGFFQSIFNEKWSYFCYVPAVTLACISGTLTIFTLWKINIKKIAIFVILIPMISQNGFIFGAQYGFFPQTFGLAFLFGLIVSILLLQKSLLSKNGSTLNRSIFVSLMLTGLLYTYNDIAPFIGAIMIFYFILLLVLNKFIFKEASKCLGIILFFTTLLVNFELIRIIKNFIDTVINLGSGNVQFGWPIYWSPIQFFANTFGFKSPFNKDLFVLDYNFSTWFFPFFVLIFLLFVYKLFSRNHFKNTLNNSLLFISANLLFILFFIKFRYFTQGFNSEEIGNTFLQYKISGWMSPFNLIALILLFQFILKNKILSTVTFKVNSLKINLFYLLPATGLIVFCIGAFIHINIATKYFTSHFLDETGYKKNPFLAFVNLKSFIDKNLTNDIIYLAFGPEHHKLRQMVAYTLMDRKLASDYTDDGYLTGHIKQEERVIDYNNAKYVIIPHATGKMHPDEIGRIGNFSIRKMPTSILTLKKIIGADARETAGSDSWHWIADKVIFEYNILGSATNFTINFDYQIATGPRDLTIVLKKNNKIFHNKSFNLKDGWGKFSSEEILLNTTATNGSKIQVEISASGKGVKLGKNDNRIRKFLIKNIQIISKN